MNCTDQIRYNNIPVMPLQQIGAPSYPYWTATPGMQYQTPTLQQPIMPPIPSTTQVMPQTPQPAQIPIQNMESQILFPTVANIGYTQGYLKSQIGSKVKIEFLIGTNMLVDREGTLVDVGISYVIIIETETDDLLLCDIYSIKFVRFYR